MRITLIMCSLMVWLAASPLLAQSLERLGQYHWQAARPEFGGLSGLELSDQGTRFHAVSDRGALFIGDILRDTGVITRVTVTGRHVLQDTKGRPPRMFLSNAEGLALKGGTIYVSYEGWARVWSYAGPDAIPEWTHAWDGFWDLIGNWGLEALAVDASGALYAISELEVPYQAHRYDGETWEPVFTIPDRDAFRVAGADFGPEGRLYIVERKFHWFSQFATRVRRLTLEGGAIVKDELLLDSPYGELDNSEGIDVWVNAEGKTIVTLLSDDNFSPLQATTLTEFRLVE